MSLCYIIISPGLNFFSNWNFVPKTLLTYCPPNYEYSPIREPQKGGERIGDGGAENKLRCESQRGK